MRRLFLPLFVGLLAFVGLTLPAYANDAAYPRIGLVLSGGGARGAAHVGVLKVLEELRIPISVVTGTSMGALVGGTYASGVSPAEMERRLTTANWDDLFVDEPGRAGWPIRRKEQSTRPTWDLNLGVGSKGVQLPAGAMAGQKVGLFFADLVRGAEGVERFDDLPIPFRAIATDLEDGGMKVFDSGSLPEAMRASMSVPGLFAPMEIDDHLYVDGGLVRNLPVDVARKMGVDLVIAVNLGSGYLPRDQLDTILGVMGQMVAILTEQNVQRSLKQLHPGKDVLIVPELGDITAADFKRAADAIKVGEAAARAAIPRLRHLSLSPEAYATWLAGRPKPAMDGPVDAVEVVGLERVNPKVFATLIAHQEGHSLDREQLDADIQRLYGYGDFESINYRVDRSGDKSRLVIDARERARGPGFLSLGLGYETDFKGNNLFGLRGTYRKPWMNELGGEWLLTAQIGNKLDLYTEFYQPLVLDRSFFVAPFAGIANTPFSVYEDGRRIARYNLLRSTAGIDFGVTRGLNTEIRLGAALGNANAEVDTGSTTLPEGSVNETGLRAALRYDTLDSSFVPRRGQRLSVDVFSPQPVMGAEHGYNRVEANWTGAHSFGPHTLLGRVILGDTFGGELPYYDQFPLGGFMRLSGYALDQFRGGQVAFGSLIVYRQVMSLQPPIGRGVYAGLSLEAADIQDTMSSLTQPGTRFGSSLFLGADTWLGPIYLGLGLSGDGDGAAYLQLGRP